MCFHRMPSLEKWLLSVGKKNHDVAVVICSSCIYLHKVQYLLLLNAHHACSGIFSNEGVSQDLGQLAGSERSVRFVSAKGSDAFLRVKDNDLKIMIHS